MATLTTAGVTFGDSTVQTTAFNSSGPSVTAASTYIGMDSGKAVGPTTSYTISGGARMFCSGTVRVYYGVAGSPWSIPCGGGSGVTTGYVKVYKNGVAVGPERAKTTMGFQYWADDFAVASGDLIQIYARGSNTEATISSELRGIGASQLSPVIAQPLNQITFS